jgi:phosphoribosyl-ATP pyrophosphohydrolase/phosphoribosyl-AMP cyclohydrolase
VSATRAVEATLDLDELDFEKGGGLVTVVTQDASSGVVLMVAHADRGALELCQKTGEMHYRSRSRGLWRKGATSGNVQHVVSLTRDCDGDAVLARVRVAGPACHSGSVSCFGDRALGAHTLASLDATIDHRASEVAAGSSYTRRLFADRNLRLKKIGEECAELIAALADGDSARAAEETADVVYHVLVGGRAAGVRLSDVFAVLEGRARERE